MPSVQRADSALGTGLNQALLVVWHTSCIVSSQCGSCPHSVDRVLTAWIPHWSWRTPECCCGCPRWPSHCRCSADSSSWPPPAASSACSPVTQTFSEGFNNTAWNNHIYIYLTTLNILIIQGYTKCFLNVSGMASSNMAVQPLSQELFCSLCLPLILSFFYHIHCFHERINF